MSETHLCESRKSTPVSPMWPAEDTWRVLPNGDRTCSFCGSLHPDDWTRLSKDVLDSTSETWIERSDKGYKFYVHQKGVRNDLEGGIKFYTWHIPSEEWAKEANLLWPDVQRLSKTKIEARMNKLRKSLQ